eukprot:gnl/TRDRNA2_/TRDRNA2_42169_c0_seq1.p1 gnl/TRDRNA2_/TRDRNA2_42169_c0~~gnl/TRDRNA2_/TRDRNA2_42169_c0_seq1.p1  ORF type:complete len:190 (-),score=36.91 gnl/TRDRNA2_/TRDRNA2_42169_c0_seq1:61-630(-)
MALARAPNLQRCLAASAAREFHVMKNSFPSTRKLQDPGVPTAVKIVTRMDSKKGAAEEEASQNLNRLPGRGARTPRKVGVHAQHLPDSYMPAATGTLSPDMPVLNRPVSAGAAAPPGWNEFQIKKMQSGMDRKGPGKKRAKKEAEVRPGVEQWGMRVLGGLLLAIACMKGQKYLFPKAKPRILGENETE